MQELRFELAAEYLVMAAILAEIKSRMLLPRSTEDEALEDDPRADLVRRLQEYERFKQADRKSDVEGKSEKVSVSLGGRLNINKKKTHQTLHPYYTKKNTTKQ